MNMPAEIVSSPVASAWRVQGRVIAALILRETHTLYGHTKLGYLWAVIQTAFSIGIFWFIREVMGAHAPHGMSMAVFLLCGFLPWYMVSKIVSGCMGAVRGNQALLTFPQVTELDLMLARVVVVWGTQLVSGTLILALAAALGQAVDLRHPASLAATLFFTPLLGLGVGLVFASLARLLPTLERLVPIFMLFLFFTSGLFFQVSELPARFSETLLLNPIAQVIEWQRYGFSASSSAPLYSVVYVAVWCLGALCLGLLLERYVRGRGAA